MQTLKCDKASEVVVEFSLTFDKIKLAEGVYHVKGYTDREFIVLGQNRDAVVLHYSPMSGILVPIAHNSGWEAPNYVFKQVNKKVIFETK